MEITIYRKESAFAPPKPTKAEIERARLMIEHKCKVRRPSLEEFAMSGEFYKLPALPSAIIKSKVDRVLDHADAGWVVPEDSFGRKPSVETVRAWIKAWLPAWINPEDYAVVDDFLE